MKFNVKDAKRHIKKEMEMGIRLKRAIQNYNYVWFNNKLTEDQLNSILKEFEKESRK